MKRLWLVAAALLLMLAAVAAGPEAYPPLWVQQAALG